MINLLKKPCKFSLEEQFRVNVKACYFNYDEDPMYTKRESELFRQFIQKFGRFPQNKEDLGDYLF